jgi:hypothetical protein
VAHRRLDRSAAAVAPSVRVSGLVGAAQLAMDQAAYDEAAQRCAQAVALARELGDLRLLAAALGGRQSGQGHPFAETR